MRLKHFPTALATLVLCPALQATECETSLPDANNLPNSLVSGHEEFVWVGTPDLAAMIPVNGHWTGMGPEHHYGDKWWWWRDGYRAMEEPDPELVITATRLDGTSPPILIQSTTNAFGPNWDRMLVGMEFPAPGCWEVIGTYRDQTLRFVFRVGG